MRKYGLTDKDILKMFFSNLVTSQIMGYVITVHLTDLSTTYTLSYILHNITFTLIIRIAVNFILADALFALG